MKTEDRTALLEKIAVAISRNNPPEIVDEFLYKTRDNPASLVGKYLDPVEYIEKVLKQKPTDIQKKIARLLTVPPYKVLVRSGNNVGKSFLGACLVNWWFDTFRPSICLTTAPNERQVKRILWKEVRTLRKDRFGFNGPKDPLLRTKENHFAEGYTARNANSFQGHHSDSMFIIFDEAQEVDAEFWEAAQPMLDGVRKAFLGIYNPMSASSQVYREEADMGYHPVVTMSCLDHPNIIAELAGLPAPYPSAVRLATVETNLLKWATPIDAHEHDAYDICLKDQWWRPGPIADSRILGRWPRQAVNSVWSKFLFEKACALVLSDTGPIQIGCDVAHFGDDFTVMHVRKGGVSLHHERHNGWGQPQIVERLKQLVVEYVRKYKLRDHKDIIVAVDDTGNPGVANFGLAQGYNFIGVNSSWVAPNEDEFPNVRSALWFGVVEAAAIGNVSLNRLSTDVQWLLMKDLMAPKYILDNRGRRVVEEKKLTKSRLGHSPDDADAFNLAYLAVEGIQDRVHSSSQVR
jgi:hypothetical protein